MKKSSLLFVVNRGPDSAHDRGSAPQQLATGRRPQRTSFGSEMAMIPADLKHFKADSEVEDAICKESNRQAGVAALQILLDRGFDPNAAPFGVSPLLLAALAGNLHAAQFLYVRGADMHQQGGVSQNQQLLPIDGASACGFLRPEARTCAI